MKKDNIIDGMTVRKASPVSSLILRPVSAPLKPSQESQVSPAVIIDSCLFLLQLL